MRSVAALAVLLIGGVAAAENADLAAARKAFDDVDFERVIPLLDKALAAGANDAEKVEIFVLMGQVHMAYGRQEEAERAFFEALSIDRSYSLPDTVAPKISAAFERARARVPIEATPVKEIPPVGGKEGDETGPTDILSQWWLWAIVGTVVAGASGIAAWQLSQPTEPAHDHGPFRF